jgi:cell division protein FtsB
MRNIRTTVAAWLEPIRGRLMIAFVLIVGLYFVLSFGEQAWRSQELEHEVDQRRSEIIEMRETRDQLEAQLEEYNSEHYTTFVEQSARRDLNLAYPGETVLLVRWNDPPAEPEPEIIEAEPDVDTPNWQRWLNFFS